VAYIILNISVQACKSKIKIICFKIINIFVLVSLYVVNCDMRVSLHS